MTGNQSQTRDEPGSQALYILVKGWALTELKEAEANLMDTERRYMEAKERVELLRTEYAKICRCAKPKQAPLARTSPE